MLDFLNENMLKTLPDVILGHFKSLGFTENEIKDCYEQLYNLKISDKLFSKSFDEELLKYEKNLPIKSMCLNISHDCNLRCRYCFASTGDFGLKRKLMSFEVSIKAINFLLKNSGSRKNLEVDFFGGEPLMNFNLIKKIVNYARSLEKKIQKKFKFTITTNGVLLDDEKIDFINKEMSNVVLSLDGRKEINDNFRVDSEKNGCYAKIVGLFQKLVRKRDVRKKYYIRGTFTRHNLDFAEDVRHLVNLGFKYISIEPVVCDGSFDYSIGRSDISEIKKEYEKLTRMLIQNMNSEKEFVFFQLIADLDVGPCAIKRMRSCSCGNEYIAVTPEGDIYPCHQFVGENEFKMGNLLAEVFDRNMKNKFSRINMSQKLACKGCFAKYFCSGGCTANSWKFQGNLLKNHEISCQLQKIRTECAIALASVKKLSNINSEKLEFFKNFKKHKTKII
jgi:uncharacterized protein